MATITDRRIIDDIRMVTAVNYHEKSDRYVVKFDGNTAKVSHEVARYLLTEVFQRRMRPVVYAHMNDTGTIDDVLLLYVSRED